jgi:hypothetical protein
MVGCFLVEVDTRARLSSVSLMAQGASVYRRMSSAEIFGSVIPCSVSKCQKSAPDAVASLHATALPDL